MDSLLISGFATAFVVSVLRFYVREHEGLLEFSDRWVVYETQEEVDGVMESHVHKWKADVIDVCRLLLGLYRVDQDDKTLWRVNHRRIFPWTCNKCLSFWTALFVVPSVFVNFRAAHEIFLYTLATAMVSFLILSLADYLHES